MATPPRTLVLACGALARETLAVCRANRLDHLDVQALPAALHLRPERIAPAVEARLAELAPRYDRILCAYADCGTQGALDRVLARYGATRLPGLHCYAAFAGEAAFDALHDREPGSFYLTDFLARHFQALVVRPLGLDRHPELAADVFRNYRRLVYLAQTDDPDLDARARAAARRLGLAYERRHTGYGELEAALVGIAA